jgi:hypothetical protein
MVRVFFLIAVGSNDACEMRQNLLRGRARRGRHNAPLSLNGLVRRVD